MCFVCQVNKVQRLVERFRKQTEIDKASVAPEMPAILPESQDEADQQKIQTSVMDNIKWRLEKKNRTAKSSMGYLQEWVRKPLIMKYN